MRRKALSTADPATPIFYSTPEKYGLAHRGGRLDFLTRSEPTKYFGVGLVRMNYEAPVSFISAGIAHLGIWLHTSSPISIASRIAGRQIDHRAGPRSVFIFPSDADLCIEPQGPAEGISIRVSAECLALAGSQLNAHGSSIVEKTDGSDELLFRIGESLEAEAAASHPNGMLFWSSAADAFLRHLAAFHLSRPVTIPRGVMSLKALKTLDDYIKSDLAAPLDLESLAAVIGCDRFHFAHRFRATIGMSPHRYVMRQRLHRACECIKSNTGSLSEIALATGFADQSHLCRWARRVYNIKLSHFRG